MMIAAFHLGWMSTKNQQIYPTLTMTAQFHRGCDGDDSDNDSDNDSDDSSVLCWNMMKK